MEGGSYEHLNLVNNSMYIYTYWNESAKVGAPTGTTAAPLAGVAWEHDTRLYNSNNPGRLEIQLCSDVPRRCYDVSAYASAYTTAYNDLNAATTKFFFQYRWFNASKPSGPIYDPLIGPVTPRVTASVAAAW